MENHITKKGRAPHYYSLEEGLTEDYLYHDLSHTLSVRDASLIIEESTNWRSWN
ncbi:MAG: hypothetical protein R2788_17670 [Saprospiraceae bacterium]